MTAPAFIFDGPDDAGITVALAPGADVAGYDLAPAVRIHWLADGDHGLKPRRASGRTEADNLDEAAAVLAAFAQTL